VKAVGSLHGGEQGEVTARSHQAVADLENGKGQRSGDESANAKSLCSL